MTTTKIKRQVTTEQEMDITFPFYYAVGNSIFYKVDEEKTTNVSEFYFSIIACKYFSDSKDFRIIDKEEFNDAVEIFKSNMNNTLSENI